MIFLLMPKKEVTFNSFFSKINIFSRCVSFNCSRVDSGFDYIIYYDANFNIFQNQE